MKKGLVLAATLVSFGLAGCVAYDPYYDGYYASPSASVVVAPTYYGHYSYRSPRYRYYDNYHYRDYR